MLVSGLRSCCNNTPSIIKTQRCARKSFGAPQFRQKERDTTALSTYSLYYTGILRAAARLLPVRSAPALPCRARGAARAVVVGTGMG